jgi:hypothetical protein
MDMGDSAAEGLPAPVSIRNGPVKDVNSPHVNGSGKRKSRGSINYKVESDSDDAPMVRAQHHAPLCLGHSS